MAYDETLASRVRELIGGEPGMAEKKMFGGLGFILNGTMACGVSGDALMVRLAPEDDEAALAEASARPFEMRGRSMRGWLLVDPPGHREDADLRRWVERGLEFARSLPPK